MHTLSMSDWCATAPIAQRAYLAQSTVTHHLLADMNLYGWQSLQQLRDVHAALAEEWPTVTWPALCGPRGADVSRFVPSLNELRMAPQDLHCLAYSHELAHAIAPHASHERTWALTHLEVLALMATNLEAPELDAALVQLRDRYQHLEVI